MAKAKSKSTMKPGVAVRDTPRGPWQPERRTWPAPRAFDRDAALAIANGFTRQNEIAIRYPDGMRTEIWHATEPAWATIVTQPDLGRDEAWFWYTIFWKRGSTSVAEAVAEPFPAEPLDRVRHDLVERVSTCFDARAYWAIAAGLLQPRERLGAFVGDGSIFVHKMQGGTSIITSWSEQFDLAEVCYEEMLSRFDAAEWDAVSAALRPAIRPDMAWDPVRLRLAAASGRFDAIVRQVVENLRERPPGLLEVLFAHRDVALLRDHVQRLEQPLYLPTPGDTDPGLAVRRWIDRFGTAHLDWVVTSIRGARAKDAVAMTKELARLGEPEVAPHMHALRETKGEKVATRWLADHAPLG